MSNEKNAAYEDAKIVLDITEKTPILDFQDYVDALYNIIKNSDPNFSVGIYGEWGTGKTTLMRAIENKIKEKEPDEETRTIIPVWFNAWRYEREDHQATIPLLKTIAYSIEKYAKFEPLSDKIIRATRTGLKEFALKAFSRHVAEVDFQKIIDDFNGNNIKFPDIDRKTIFYDGLREIKEEIQNIRSQKNSPYRIVVFIDDLDRCSREKTLEVFESIKAFLDVSGFIFIIGLSFHTTSELITDYYENKINGEDYIKKIIQVPIFVQHWNHNDVSMLIKNIADDLESPYNTIIGNNNNVKLLEIALEKNPREVKRFINTFIISNEIYAKSTEHTTLLQVQCLKWRWREIYDVFSNQKIFRNAIKNLLALPWKERLFQLENIESGKNLDELSSILFTEKSKIEDELLDIDLFVEHFKKYFTSLSDDFWEFLSKANLLLSLKTDKDWEPYRRASSASDEKGRDESIGEQKIQHSNPEKKVCRDCEVNYPDGLFGFLCQECEKNYPMD